MTQTFAWLVSAGVEPGRTKTELFGTGGVWRRWAARQEEDDDVMIFVFDVDAIRCIFQPFRVYIEF